MTDSAAAPSAQARRPIALVTGPTSGLGASFARVLAERGHDLILVARNEERLRTLAKELADIYGATSEVIVADLATELGRDATAARLAQGVDVLVNNAGFLTDGEFWDTDLELLRDQLAVNVTAVLELTHAALPAMRAAGRGTVVNVASVSGLFTGPASTYSASKSWVVKFSEGLAHKLAADGIHMVALCPGFMDTEFHPRGGQDVSGVPKALWLDTDDVARTGLDDAANGRFVSIPGRRYKLFTTLDRIKPRRLVWRA
ncbi:SDR family NAD(P)-dependent oxidoreductase [Rhodococcus chondri]|uniref:SDR family oxidoreductase n=1 Tax=Rhodococcus chondri TaxID=3065941 RepID=A0ABU7JQ92_9NOCA|nr:SDR family oxidoreductase [Rhodococcus sp. CC-R104]MEE2032190.1 SDR family oxidoreductase [Rhodococcus sp. CC-R104]